MEIWVKNSRRSAVHACIVMGVVESAQQGGAPGRHIIHIEVEQPATRGAR
jgi:hypothetical protein